jgi:hypothetical protein
VNDARPVVNFTATPGTMLNIVVNATDPETDAITYAAYFMRADLGMTFTPATRTFSWNAPIGASDSTYYVRFQITTFSGGSDYAIAKITVADRMPPAAVTDLQPTMGHTTAVMTWHSPGDNGNVGNATAFDLRYSSSPINEGNFSLATQIPTGDPGPPGNLNCADLSGLSPCGAYWFAVKTVDDAGNWSSLSNLPSGQATCSGSLEYACASPQDGPGLPPRPKGADLPQTVEFAMRGPNPTHTPLEIMMGIPSALAGQQLRLRVFDIAGRRVRDLRAESASAGRFSSSWDLHDQSGSRVANGLYFIRFDIGAERHTHSVMVVN